jgi:pyrroloquinoline quinone biosynthesis protein B
MLVKVLGAAAGGAFPQWNCACQQCSRLRSGTFPGHVRTQAQVAVSEDGVSWTLLNASPDLRTQIEAIPELWPKPESCPKNESLDSPVRSIVITAAEADTVAGLLSLREFQPLDIYATPSVLRILREDNSLFALLNRVPNQAKWKEIRPDVAFEAGGLNFRPFSLTAGFPGFIKAERKEELDPAEAVLGLWIDSESGARLAYLPSVARIDESWRSQLDECEVLLFDGTFWTEDELCGVRGRGKKASEMGHLALSGPCGSLAALQEIKCPRKIFFHINNTNPILDESSEAFAEVQAAGWEVAMDGMEIGL